MQNLVAEWNVLVLQEDQDSITESANKQDLGKVHVGGEYKSDKYNDTDGKSGNNQETKYGGMTGGHDSFTASPNGDSDGGQNCAKTALIYCRALFLITSTYPFWAVVQVSYPGRRIPQVFVQVLRKFGMICSSGYQYRYNPTFAIAKRAFHPGGGRDLRH